MHEQKSVSRRQSVQILNLSLTVATNLAEAR
jgi:hypothetical protein